MKVRRDHEDSRLHGRILSEMAEDGTGFDEGSVVLD
jgi:hypothetical protein